MPPKGPKNPLLLVQDLIKEKPGKRHFRAKFDAVIELNALEGAVGGLLGDEAGAWGQVQGEDACGIR